MRKLLLAMQKMIDFHNDQPREPGKIIKILVATEKFIFAYGDFIMIFILITILSATYFSVSHQSAPAKIITVESKIVTASSPPSAIQSLEVETEKTIEKKIPDIEWSSYTNNWYGFEIKYPADWSKPLSEKPTTGANWEYRYLFRKTPLLEDEGAFLGFDVVIYNVTKTAGYYKTDEFPSPKSSKGDQTTESCLMIGQYLHEGDSYPAEEVYIPTDDRCFYPGFFYTLTRDNYVYNIVPITRASFSEKIDLRREALIEFPEFFGTAESLELTKIIRPKPKPVITAPHPASYKIDSKGRMVCAKKNDKPGKSKQGKDKHLDMECCLDSDEYPNPWCYYDPAKYGKYLK